MNNETLINQLARIQAKQDMLLFLTRSVIESFTNQESLKAKIEDLVCYLEVVYENEMRDAEGLERLSLPDYPDGFEDWPEILRTHNDEEPE